MNACLASEEASLVTGSILDVDGGSDLVTAHVGTGSHDLVVDGAQRFLAENA